MATRAINGQIIGKQGDFIKGQEPKVLFLIDLEIEFDTDNSFEFMDNCIKAIEFKAPINDINTHNEGDDVIVYVEDDLSSIKVYNEDQEVEVDITSNDFKLFFFSVEYAERLRDDDKVNLFNPHVHNEQCNEDGEPFQMSAFEQPNIIDTLEAILTDTRNFAVTQEDSDPNHIECLNRLLDVLNEYN